MNTKTAYKEFLLRFNKLDTNFSTEIDEKKFCALFNKAQNHYVKNLLKNESSNKVVENTLQLLLESSILNGIHSNDIYLVDLPKDFLWSIRVSCQDTKCKNTLNCRLVNESSVNNLLQNPNWKPSVEWEETFYTLGKDQLRIYLDNFRVENCNLVYYKEPPKVDIKTGLKNIYDLDSQDVNPIWKETITEEIIDIAVLIASSDVSDVANFTSKSQLKPLNS